MSPEAARLVSKIDSPKDPALRDLLASLLNNPAGVPELSTEAAAALLGELERFKALLWARLTGSAHEGASEGWDELVTDKQAAERLGTTPDWLGRHRRSLPFVVRLSKGQIRYSTKGIERYIKTRMRSHVS